MEQKTKIALVTGGSRGLGKDISIALAKKGIDIILIYNTNSEAAKAVVAQIEKLGQKAYAFQLDTAKTNSFDDFVKTVTATLQKETGNPNFDFLINNAGTALYARTCFRNNRRTARHHFQCPL